MWLGFITIHNHNFESLLIPQKKLENRQSIDLAHFEISSGAIQIKTAMATWKHPRTKIRLEIQTPLKLLLVKTHPNYYTKATKFTSHFTQTQWPEKKNVTLPQLQKQTRPTPQLF
jgi:hypothetical protein